MNTDLAISATTVLGTVQFSILTEALSAVNNDGPRWGRATVVVTDALGLRGAHVSLIQVSPFRTTTALHRSVIHRAARVITR